MIGRLKGQLWELIGSIAVVNVGGVGYEVVIPDSVLVRMPLSGEEVDLRIRQVFREDGQTLYGFIDLQQRRLFDLLTEVKGCGPKIALSLIGQLGEETVMAGIAGGDARVLARASGVGPRLAERIILELKDKIAEEQFLKRTSSTSASTTSSKAVVDDELVDALMALGYRRPEAETAAKEAREKAVTVEEQIKVALRSLAK